MLKKLFLTSSLLLAFSPFVTWGAPPAVTKKILVLDSQTISPYIDVRESTIRHLKDYGYNDKQNLEIEIINIGNYVGTTLNTLKDLANKKYDLYFINGTVALQGALEYVKIYKNHQPIVFANVTDPIGLGAIKQFNASPIQNITGVSYPVSLKKRFLLLKQLVPGLKKIGYIYSDMPQSNAYAEWMKTLFRNEAELKGLEVIYKKVEFIKSTNGHKRMVRLSEQALAEIDAKVDVYVSPNDQLGSSSEFAEMITQHSKHPVFGLANEPYTFASLSPNFDKNGKALAQMISKIFEGGKISNIYPQESSSKICLNFPMINKYPIIKIPKNIKDKKQNTCFEKDNLSEVSL